MKILKSIFAIFGILSALIVLVFVGVFFWGMNWSGEKINQASEKDVLFVLNWGGLSSSQKYEVLHSYQSVPNFLGDHLDYYCIQLEKFSPNSRSINEWVFGIEDQPMVNEARNYVASMGKSEACFNEKISGIENDVAAYIWSINIHGRRVDGAQIILYHKPLSLIHI